MGVRCGKRCLLIVSLPLIFFCTNADVHVHAWQGLRSSPPAGPALHRRVHVSAISSFRLHAYPKKRRSNRLPPVNDSTRTFNRRLQEVANARNRNRSIPAQKADDMLRTLLDDIDEARDGTTDGDVLPNAVSFSIVISAWRRSRSKDSPQRAQEWLADMAKRYALSGDAAIKPNAFIFCSVARTLAASRQIGTTEKADKLLWTLEQLRAKSNDCDLVPDAATYTQVINSYANLQNYKNKRNGNRAANAAESMLKRMRKIYQQTGDERIKPDKIVYGSVIVCWAALGGSKGATRAENVLRQLEHEYEKSGDDPDLKPGAVIYTSLIKAVLSGPNSYDDMERAEALFVFLCERYRETGDIDLAPDAMLYGTLMDGWASVGGRDAAERAERLLRLRVELYEDGNDSVKPDVVSYTQCLKAWSTACSESRGDSFGAERAEAILTSMEDAFAETEDWDLKPDSVSYCVVMNAWANVGTELAALKAEQLLMKLGELYDEGDEEMKPNIFHITTCISAWCNSVKDGNRDNAVEHIVDLLSIAVDAYELGQMDMRPTDVTFRVAIRGSGTHAGGVEMIQHLRERVEQKNRQR